MTLLGDEELAFKLEREISSLVTLSVKVETFEESFVGESRARVQFIVIMYDNSDPKKLELRNMQTRSTVDHLLHDRDMLIHFVEKLLSEYAVGRFYEVAF